MGLEGVGGTGGGYIELYRVRGAVWGWRELGGLEGAI